MRVLIADDKAVNRRVLKNMIEEMHMTPVEACDGTEAIEILSQEDAPQIALIDWVMPNVSGLEVCRHICRERATSENYKYVILVTSKDKDHEIEAGFDAGADDYITRPFHLNELKMRLRVGVRIMKMQHDLLTLLHCDPLTHALNRRAVVARLNEEIKQLARIPTSLSVAMLDIDYFKEVNDMHGHLEGDILLTEATRRIRSVLRSYDHVGRYGGDEFLLVFPHTNATDATMICERIRDLFEQQPLVSNHISHLVTVSIGIASGAGPYQFVADDFIRQADIALYSAKRRGRNQVFLLDKEMRDG